MVFAAKSFLLLSYKRLKFACLFFGNHFNAQFRFSRHFGSSTGLVTRPTDERANDLERRTEYKRLRT